jgi:hypothetical protein
MSRGGVRIASAYEEAETIRLIMRLYAKSDHSPNGVIKVVTSAVEGTDRVS